MIIDIHRHVWSSVEQHDLSGESPLVPDWEERGQDIIAEMDGAGVDVSVLLLAEYGLRLGDATFTVDRANRIQVEMVKRYPKQFIPFFGSDPRRPGAADHFEKALKEWGVKGLKVHATVGFFPHDRICYPFYELCVQYNVPVLFHSGPMGGRLFSRYTQPLQFDEVAADFPDLSIVLAHSGQDLWPEALNVARGKPNINLELSMWQRDVIQRPQEVLYAVDRMRNTIGIERIIWGSDFPGLRSQMPLKAWVESFQRLPSLGEEHGFKFNQSDVDAILGGNAARVLKL